MLCGPALPASAQQTPPTQLKFGELAQAPAKAPTTEPPPLAVPSTGETGVVFGGALAPGWADPIANVPNFFGTFAARGLGVGRNTFVSGTLTYTGVGAEGIESNFSFIQGPVTVSGPKGPFTLIQNIPTPDRSFSTGLFTLSENPELTAQVKAKFPTATFVSGNGSYPNLPIFGEPLDLALFTYNYLFTSGQVTNISLPNPAGGGLVGRLKYFDNGTPLPHDRVYFFYDHVGDFRGLGTRFNVDRYTFGGEKTFLDGAMSLEFRMPFAGTANSDQHADEGLSVGRAEFGNVGLALKGAIYRTPNFVVSVGVGVSLPTANDSRMIVNGMPVVQIDNRTCLIQPLFGFAWAPNDRFYFQSGLQFDLDPSGNPVRALDANGGLSRVGVFNDQSYSYLNTAAGYWFYVNPTGRVTAIAFQGECHYTRTFGRHDRVQDGTVTITDQSRDINAVDGTTGFIFRLGERANFSLGFTFPLSGNRISDWDLVAQLNFAFGGPR
jgi:hypothetical protein